MNKIKPETAVVIGEIALAGIALALKIVGVVRR